MKYLSLLRGINVGGNKLISMVDLKDLYLSLGFQDVQTYIQSGNVVFESEPLDSFELRLLIESKLQDRYGFEVTVFVLPLPILDSIFKRNPYPAADAKSVYFSFLSSFPDQSFVADLYKLLSPSERFHITESCVYFYCPEGYGKTKLTNAILEKKLKVKATTRNFNTVSTLLTLMGQME